MKINTKNILQNKFVLYLVFFLSLVSVFGYITTSNYQAVLLFVLISLLTNYFSKNMIVILGAAILGTYLVTLINGSFVINNSNNVVEGFTGSESDKVADKINTDTSNIIDNLHISKYRTNYEDIINNMKVWTDAMLLKSIVSDGIDTDANLTSDNLKKIAHINHLESFKKSCDLALTVLDNN